MRLSSLASARPAYYDRNATTTVLSTGITVAPHSQTTRVTSTIAAGKKAYIEYVYGMMIRVTAATTAGFMQITPRFTSGGTSAILAQVITVTNSLTTAETKTITGTITLYGGEVFDINSQDQSTGGTVYYEIAAKLTNFDA